MYNDNLFLATIKAAGETLADCSKALGICDNALYKKRIGKTQFTLDELRAFKAHYHCDDGAIACIFFASEPN